MIFPVKRLKQKIAIATAIAVIKLSKSQGVEPATYAKDLQKYYFKQKEVSRLIHLQIENKCKKDNCSMFVSPYTM